MKSRVKEIMEQQGFTIQALAEKTGLAQETIKRARDHRIEACTLKTLKRIANELGVEVHKIYE